jgi:hypothetical protein
MQNLRVGASVGHGEEERAVVLQFEVLIGELLAIDALTAGALIHVSQLLFLCVKPETYVAASEVTTLEHELGNHAVEL